jgi:hypothetical protein
MIQTNNSSSQTRGLKGADAKDPYCKGGREGNKGDIDLMIALDFGLLTIVSVLPTVIINLPLPRPDNVSS